MNKRVIYTFVAILLTFSFACARIVYVINDKTYKANINNSSKTVEVGTVRGTIFDCNSIPITNSEYEYIAAVPPTSKAIKSVVKYNLSASQREKLLTGYPACVKVDKNYSCDGVSVFKIPKRYSGIAAHTIGYFNSANEGVCGIEQSFNSILKGKTIKVNFKTDVKGNVLSNTQTVENDTGYQGNGVKLTIDKNIQTICESVGKKYINKGAIIVLENKTGKIRAMASFPSFDPNQIEKSVDSPSSPFFNRAIASYNCGSVFKLCVGAAALENKVSLEFNCKGSVNLGKNKFSCLAHHGRVALADAIAKSCNCFFVKLGQKIGANKLYQTAKNFGFGIETKLSDGIVSASGSLPSLSYLDQNPAELANFSFGQGRLMVTPIQIASMIQCISNNGKLIKPSLVEGITDENGKVVSATKQTKPTYVITSETALYLQKCMIKTINEGTGKNAKPNSVGAGGKTATAETGIYDREGKAVYQTWFGGFYPEKNPAYTIVVLCENGNSGSKSAAPVFKEIVDNMYVHG